MSNVAVQYNKCSIDKHFPVASQFREHEIRSRVSMNVEIHNDF